LPTRPALDCSLEEKASYFTALFTALSAIGLLNHGTIPSALVPTLSEMPKCFSNFNWDLTHEIVRSRLRQYRKDQRDGRTVSEDVLKYFADLEAAGVATIFPLNEGSVVNGVLQQYGVFIQTGLQQDWMRDISGISAVVGCDDSFNMTGYNMPYFVAMGTDAITRMQLPLFQSFLVYQTKEQYAKARMMYWMYKQAILPSRKS
jgi:hypothetical protein